MTSVNSSTITYHCTDADYANTTYCQNEFQRASDAAFATSFIFNMILFFVFLVGFLIFKRFQACKRVYVYRTDVSPPPEGLFGWFWGAWAVSEREIVLKRGLDSAIYLLSVKYFVWMTILMLPYGIILIITHSTSGGSSVGIASIGMGNVPSGSRFLIADLIGVFWNTTVVLIVMYRLYWRFVELRLSQVQRVLAAENYTVMVREVGPTTTDAEVRDTFERLFPGKIVAVNRAYNVRSFKKASDLREKIIVKLETAHAVYLKKGEWPLTGTRPNKLWCCPPRTDAKNFFSRALAEIDDKLAAKRAALQRDDTKKRLPVFFVTFADIVTAQKAAQCIVRTAPLHYCFQESWTVDRAPPPASVDWGALRIGYLERFVREILVLVATVLLVFFWAIPVTFAASLANLTVLITLLGFLEPLANVETIRGFIEGFLPGLVIIIFFALLVDVIIRRLLVGNEGHADLGRANESVMTKYYLFLVFNVFFVYALAGGVFNALPELIESPLSIVQILATSLPQQVQQFLSYVMIASLSQFTMELWRPGDAIKPWLLSKFWFLAKTKRARRNLWGPYEYHYTVSMAVSLLVTVIVLTYSTLNPLMLPFGLVYYGLAYTTHLYNVVYVYSNTVESNGEYFPAVFARVMVSLLVYQICMAGTLGLKEFEGAAAVIAPILITCAIWYYTHYQLRVLSHGGVLLSDKALQSDVEELQILRKVHPAGHTYRCPSLAPPLVDVEDQDPNAEEQSDTMDFGDTPPVIWVSAQGGTQVDTLVMEQFFDDESVGGFNAIPPTTTVASTTTTTTRASSESPIVDQFTSGRVDL